jgi:hypothetical protein
MKKLLILGLMIFSQTVFGEEPTRVHCVGSGTRLTGSILHNSSLEIFYEFYKDRMTERVGSSNLNFTKDEIVNSDKVLGRYEIDSTHILVINVNRINDNDGKTISSSWYQSSIDRETGKWDLLMMNSGGLFPEPESTTMSGSCESWILKKKF